MQKKLLSCFALYLFVFLALSEDSLSSYAQKNKGDYEAACVLYENIKTHLEMLGYKNVELPLALVFPELMRYSRLRDEMETLYNKALATAGFDSEGCSIGYFQIKPVFAISVEREILKEPHMQSAYQKINFKGVDETRKSRLLRIQRLRNEETAFLYLCAFIEICDKKYDLSSLKTEDRLRLLATAYNSGFYWTRETLQKIAQQNSYPDGFNAPKSLWNYAQLCVDFYRRIAP